VTDPRPTGSNVTPLGGPDHASAMRATHTQPTASGPEQVSVGRAGLLTAISNAIEFARMSQRSVGLLMVELVRPDKLEAIVGTSTAEVMAQSMRRLPAALRSVDRAVAVSDSKIVILLPNMKTDAQSWLAAGKVQRTLDEAYSIGGEMLTVRPLIGIATYPEHAELAEELIVHADIAVGIAKARDISQHVFQKEDRGESDVYLGLEAPLREAIRLNQLELYYQPQIDLKTGKPAAAEALLRWTAPDLGTVSPATIVRIAEANGIIGALTTWVINAAMRQQAEWRKRGVLLGLSLNLSTLNLTDDELPDVISQALGTWNVDPASMTFEVTESATVSDAARSTMVLNRLKSLGVKLAVDDFGTGYSSLSYLKNFPLDELKIDRLFIRELTTSVADQRIVRSVVGLAHEFGMKVVAEGVEDDATARELKKLGCDLVQGFIHSQALNADSFADWFVQRR
jgi:diguanylate cyclase